MVALLVLNNGARLRTQKAEIWSLHHKLSDTEQSTSPWPSFSYKTVHLDFLN